jgi:hypothetical protein
MGKPELGLRASERFKHPPLIVWYLRRDCCLHLWQVGTMGQNRPCVQSNNLESRYFNFRKHNEPGGTVVHSCVPNTQEAEAGGW